MVFKRNYNKYLVIKQEDCDEYLTKEELISLDNLIKKIDEGRRKAGKRQNSYVVVNEDEPYSELVWKLIELSITSPEELDILLTNLSTEILGY